MNYLDASFTTDIAMKIKTLFSFALLLVTLSGFSQTYVTQIKSVETKKWGYANQKGDLSDVMSLAVMDLPRSTIRNTKGFTLLM